MKKIVQTADTGGGPITKKDLREIFNDELWDVVESIFYPYNSDVQGIIVSGCVITNNSGNFDMTAGIVYLNGEFMRIAAVTNQTFTKYIAPSSVVNDDRTFGDGNVHTIATTTGAQLSSSAPGSGQYITISSLTSADARRLSNIIVNRQIATQFQLTLEALGGLRTEGSGAYLKTKIVQIGPWNMTSNSFVNVTHGIADYKKIRSVTGVIRNDADSVYTAIGSAVASSGAGTSVPGDAQLFCGSISSTTITVSRTDSGIFDSNTAYDDTSGSYNRGWLTIQYEA